MFEFPTYGNRRRDFGWRRTVSDKLTKRDREFLRKIGVSTNGHAAPESAPDNSPAFSPSDMEARGKRLKAEGKMPPLADVLEILRKVVSE
jgi:hypothetical protein